MINALGLLNVTRQFQKLENIFDRKLAPERPFIAGIRESS